MSARPRKKRSGWQRWGFVLFPLVIVGLLGLLFLGVDQLCVNDANRRLPYYPGAVRVEAQHNGLRLRGVGNSLEVVSTPDSRQEVEAWFEARAVERLTSGRTRGVNTVSHWIETPAEGETRIFYLSQCVM